MMEDDLLWLKARNPKTTLVRFPHAPKEIKFKVVVGTLIIASGKSKKEALQKAVERVRGLVP